MTPPSERIVERRSTIPADPLDRAAETVIEELTAAAEGVVDPEVVRAEVEAVLRDLRATLDGEAPSPLGPDATDRLALTRSLRTTALEQWSDEDDSPLPVFRAFDALERHLLDWGSQVTVTDLLTPFSRKLLREVAHALRSPLGSMVALADSLREERAGPLNDVQAHQLGIVHRAALTAATMVGDVLSVVSEEDPFEQPSRFTLAETLNTVAELVRPVTETRSSKLEVGPGDTKLRSGPASAVTNALLTLGLRAALMTRDGTVSLATRIDDGDRVTFTVTTDGVTATSEEDAAEQLRVLRMNPDSDSFTVSSHGLAVAAAREAVRRIGSELRLEPDDGALRMSFTVELPVAR